MAGYVFLSNSTKPTKEEQNSREPIELTNVSRPCLEIALDKGYDVFFGTNRANPESLECELPVRLYDSHTYRSITNIKDNKVAYNNLENIVRNNDIEVIHCNTPVGGLIGRLIGKKYNIKKVIYTAHGFHFFKGAPKFNNSIIKFAEIIMAHWTDAIITMNEEDYQAAKKFKLKKNGKVFKVHGVGINLDQINDVSVNIREKRKSLNLSEDDIVCISAGDLTISKNYYSSINAISKVKNENVKYIICGDGVEKNKLKKFSEEKGVSDRVYFLGFRKDVIELMKMSDIFLFTTLREGLPRSMMEAMACGLPCVASKIRGNVDLLYDNKGGYLINPNDIDNIAESIENLSIDNKLRRDMGKYNLNAIKEYDISVVKKEIRNIYDIILTD